MADRAAWCEPTTCSSAWQRHSGRVDRAIATPFGPERFFKRNRQAMDSNNTANGAQVVAESSGNITQIPRALELLQEQVAVLQLHAAERKTPWYKERSLLVAIGSLFVALFTAGEAVVVRGEQTTQQRIAALRATTIELVELQREFIALQAPSSSIDMAASYGRSIALNTKRQLLLQSAGELLLDDKVRARTSAHTFLSLGGEMMMDGRYKDAETLFLQSLEAANRNDDELMRVWAGRTLGALYRIRGTRLDDVDRLTAKSRQLFATAAGVAEHREDDFGHKTVGETLIYQAQTEMASGDAAYGREAALKAKSRVERMHEHNPVRASLLGVIQQILLQTTPATAASALSTSSASD